MITLLSSASFVADLTVDADGNVYRFIRSFPNGAAEAELLGDVTDLSESDHVALAGDDRARCVVAGKWLTQAPGEGAEHAPQYLLLEWPDMAVSKRLPTLRSKDGKIILDWELSSNRQFLTALGRRWSLEDGEPFSEGAINLYELA